MPGSGGLRELLHGDDRRLHVPVGCRCVIAWSLGNEAGYGPVHDSMAAYLRHKDVSRVVHYEGGGSTTPSTDLLCPMYARLAQITALAEEHADRPVVLCEYAHAMGNSGGGLAEYWHLFKSNPRCQGGFIWDWYGPTVLPIVEVHARHWSDCMHARAATWSRGLETRRVCKWVGGGPDDDGVAHAGWIRA